MNEIIEKIEKKGLFELIKLRVDDDELIFKQYIEKNKLIYVLYINRKIDVTDEKYNRKKVKNISGYKNKEAFKKCLIKIYGKKQGISKLEEEWTKAHIVLYTPNFPSKSAIIKKIKELIKEGKKVIWLD